MNEVIPEAAVEAAARLLWAKDSELINEVRPLWDDIAALHNPVWSAVQEDTRQDAREILEAAAPHMLAGAWEEGRDAEFQRSVMKRQVDPNPYRT